MHEVERGVARVGMGVEDLKAGAAVNNAQTAEMYEIFSTAKGGFRMIELIGRGAKPVFLIFAVGTAILVGIKTGVWKWPS